MNHLIIVPNRFSIILNFDEFYLHVKLISLCCFIQLRESIAQDEAKTETLNCQMQELDMKIQNIDREINQTEPLLKDLKKLESQIATKTGERKSKYEELQKRKAALTEENIGLSYDCLSSFFHYMPLDFLVLRIVGGGFFVIFFIIFFR